jgi:hypothetical protein
LAIRNGFSGSAFEQLLVPAVAVSVSAEQWEQSHDDWSGSSCQADRLHWQLKHGVVTSLQEALTALQL